MIGDAAIELTPVSNLNDAYVAIWEKVRAEPDAHQWFAPIKPIGYESSRGNVLTCLWFMAVGFVLFVDSQADPSEWNNVNLPFFFVLLAMIVLGAFWAALGVGETLEDERLHHKFVARRGIENLGVCDVYQDKPNRTCMIEVAMLPQFRGQKLGSVVGRLMIRKCFTEFDAHRVESTALSTNEASMKMHDGMIAEGVLKDRYTARGQPVSEHWFRLLRPEWDAQIASRK